ncbi:hypothetical protein [Frankia sp. CiP3]|uniref:hypothetical protein n=1 Tax=Frankia sp. CiP3 TaxID=2880971 RepID=UPI001EF63F4F|nr:hypothetical protein [Frankia sp. CiP3]
MPGRTPQAADPADEATADSAAAGDEIAEGYEQLRRRELADGPDAWRYGRGLLAGRGMAAWLAAWSALAIPAAGTGGTGHAAPPASPGTQEGGETRTTGRASPPAGTGDDLVAVLAQMALAHVRTTPTTEGDSR